MKWLIGLLVMVLLALQYRLWVGEGSLAHIAALEKEIARQQAEIDLLRDRNHKIEREVKGLKSGLERIEERARSELGLVKEGETLFLLPPEKSPSTKQQQP